MFEFAPNAIEWPERTADATPLTRYTGPERRMRASGPLDAVVCEEIDYGVLVVDTACRVLQANRVARVRLACEDALILELGRVRCTHTADCTRLDTAVRAASLRGLRRLISLGNAAGALGIAVVPFPKDEHGSVPVMLLLSRAQVCEPLSAQWFARCHGLTPAESRVLWALCSGQRPGEIAKSLGVAISTVRTQIGALRAKTEASTIAELVHRVAQLPPMMNTLRDDAAS